jgi:GDP-4-dehydro-6-deoxy-D-mannose reductase
MKRVLVTGAHSFTARHLLALLAAGTDPAATPGPPPREGPAPPRAGPAGSREVVTSDVAAAGPPGLEYVRADLSDRAQAHELARAARPDLVFHLAGATSVEADLCYAINLDGTRHLLEACAGLPAPPIVLVVSSAAVYGLTRPEESPVREETPLRPVTAYGASKAAAEVHALSLHRRGALRVVVVRPFNLVGPGLREGFAPSDFVRQALAIRAGAPPEVRVGDLDPRRDFLDVRDAARAYLQLAGTAAAWGGVFNVASGRPVAIRDLLERVLRIAGVEARVVHDPARAGRVEVAEQVGDAGALARATAWSARLTLDESLRDMIAAV